MNTILIFACVWAAMIAMGFWESNIEGRNAWDKKKYGWKLKIGKYILSEYHFFLFIVMLPALLLLPFVVSGWNLILFGVLLSAFTSGMIIEDLTWYLVNPKVKFKELYTKFSDYYPWVRIGKRKIIPVGYLLGIIVAVLSWYFIWR